MYSVNFKVFSKYWVPIRFNIHPVYNFFNIVKKIRAKICINYYEQYNLIISFMILRFVKQPGSSVT